MQEIQRMHLFKDALASNDMIIINDRAERMCKKGLWKFQGRD